MGDLETSIRNGKMGVTRIMNNSVDKFIVVIDTKIQGKISWNGGYG